MAANSGLTIVPPNVTVSSIWLPTQTRPRPTTCAKLLASVRSTTTAHTTNNTPPVTTNL